MSKPAHPKRLVWIAGGLLALLATDQLVVTPAVRGFRSRSARIAELRDSVARGDLLVGRESALRARWTAMETAALPVDAATAEDQVLQAIARWARDHRVTLTSLVPRWRPHEDGFQVLECRASAQGDLAALARFLHALQTDALPLRIEQFDLAAADDRGQRLILNARFSGLQIPAAERGAR